MSVQTVVESINSVQRRVKFSVSAEKVSAAFADAYRNIQRRTSIRGFRPGKAPLAIVQKLYGESVAPDVADQIVREALAHAMRENKLTPVTMPDVDVTTLPKPNDVYEFSAVFDIMPVISDLKYKDLKLVVHRHEVDDAAVTESLERYRQYRAKRRSVAEGSIVAEDSIVTIKAAGEEYEIPMTADTDEQLRQLFLGTRVGEKKAVDVQLLKKFEGANTGALPEDGSVETEITNLQENILPDLNDEFAVDGGFKDLTDMRERFKADLVQMYDRTRRNELSSRVRAALIKENQFDLPPGLVAQTINNWIEGDPASKNKNKLPSSPEELEAQRKELLPQAKSSLAYQILIFEIAKLENISATDEELRESYVRQAIGNVPLDDENAKNYLGFIEKHFKSLPKSQLDEMRANLMAQKTVDRIIELAKIEEHVHAPNETCDQ